MDNHTALTNMLLRKQEFINIIIYSKYKFKCLLTKDPSETSSLEYKTKTNYTVIFLYFTNIRLCVC